MITLADLTSNVSHTGQFHIPEVHKFPCKHLLSPEM